jgi:hypothetical protein
MPPLKTRQAAKFLGVSYWRLVAQIRGDKLDPPVKDASGDFVWSDADLARARQALATDRRRKEAKRA